MRGNGHTRSHCEMSKVGERGMCISKYCTQYGSLSREVQKCGSLKAPDVRRWDPMATDRVKQKTRRCDMCEHSRVTGQARSRAEGPAWRVRHNETGQRKRPRSGRDGGTGAQKKHTRAAHRMMPSARCCGSSSLRIAWESHVYLRGHRRSNRRLWAGTRALPQRPFGPRGEGSPPLGPRG